MIIEEHKTTFVHIPKNAGTSIEKCFGTHNLDTTYNGKKAWKHDSISTIKHKFPEKYESYRKFAIIRNPYGRMVSWYFHLKKEAEMDIHPDGLLGSVENFKKAFPYEFIKWLEDPFKTQYTRWKLPGGVLDGLLRNPQCTWIDETVTILRYENLNKEINEFFKKEISLPVANKSIHMSYLNYYNKYALDIVYERYKEDFEKFNYERIEKI